MNEIIAIIFITYAVSLLILGCFDKFLKDISSIDEYMSYRVVFFIPFVNSFVVMMVLYYVLKELFCKFDALLAWKGIEMVNVIKITRKNESIAYLIQVGMDGNCGFLNLMTGCVSLGYSSREEALKGLEHQREIGKLIKIERVTLKEVRQ